MSTTTAMEWLKGNIITLVIVVGGFVVTVLQLQGSVQSIEGQLNTLNTTIQQIQGNQTEERLSYKGLEDTLDMHSKDILGLNDHLKAVDAGFANLKDSLQTLLTNQQLVNQQIQFLTNEKTVPSRK